MISFENIELTIKTFHKHSLTKEAALWLLKVYKLEHPKFDFSSYPRFGSNDFETDDTYLGIDSCIMYLINGIMELNRYRNSKNMFIGSVEDFLKLFKIPLEDIV